MTNLERTAVPLELIAAVGRKLASSYRQGGMRLAVSLLKKNLLYRIRVSLDAGFDRRHRVETSGWAFLEKLDIESANKELGIRYQPSSEMHLRCMFSCLPSDLREFTFVDFGSGKGRVLLAASQYPFKRIVGVEFSRELHAKSLENIRRYRSESRKCFDVSAVCMDASDFTVPDGPCVFYFFDPFRDRVMKRVLDNIAGAYKKGFAKMFVMYYAPLHCQFLEELQIFRRVSTQPLPFDLSLPMQYKFALFETCGRPVTASES